MNNICPKRVIKTSKLTLTSTVTIVDTKSQPCILHVVSGNVYVAGKRDGSAGSDSFPISSDLEFFGELYLVSDGTGADVRLMYYDVM